MSDFWKTAVILSLITFAAITLILSGRFDPQPYGEPVWEKGHFLLRAPAHGQKIVWLGKKMPEGDFSLRLTAVHINGHSDNQYGLILGSDTEKLAITLSSAGYAAIEWKTVIMPYAPFPHVHHNDVNEIWLDMGTAKDGIRPVTVRLNRELFWQGDIDLLHGGIGVMVENFGESETIAIRVDTLTLFQ